MPDKSPHQHEMKKSGKSIKHPGPTTPPTHHPAT